MSETWQTALARLDAGDWEGAHAIVQSADGAEAAWLHAHLHRLEGDASNAGYWYRRAGRAPFAGTEEEREALRALVQPARGNRTARIGLDPE